MPQPYKGLRRRVTVRLPVDLYRKVAVAAHERRWSVSEFVAFAAEQQMRRESLRNERPRDAEGRFEAAG